MDELLDVDLDDVTRPFNSTKQIECGIDGTICNLLDAGIIDPTRVTRLALQNASSVSINLLSIGCSMVEDSLTSTD